MTDMLKAVMPKSDQLNSDSLIGGQTRTITITKVEVVKGEQPTIIHYDGENGRPYKPCKSMARVLIHCWGSDGSKYIGRSMMLYCDPTVRYGGMEVGGIRISHLSHIDQEATMLLTSTRSNRKPYTVKPLVVIETPSVDVFIKDIKDVPTLEGLQHKFMEASKAHKHDPRFPEVVAAKDARKIELTSKAILC